MTCAKWARPILALGAYHFGTCPHMSDDVEMCDGVYVTE